MRSMGGCSKAEKNGSSIRKMAFLRKIPLCHHDSRKYRGCDADSLMQNSRFLRYLYVKGKDAICIRRSPYNYGRLLL